MHDVGDLSVCKQERKRVCRVCVGGVVCVSPPEGKFYDGQ